NGLTVRFCFALGLFSLAESDKADRPTFCLVPKHDHSLYAGLWAGSCCEPFVLEGSIMSSSHQRQSALPNVSPIPPVMNISSSKEEAGLRRRRRKSSPVLPINGTE